MGVGDCAVHFIAGSNCLQAKKVASKEMLDIDWTRSLKSLCKMSSIGNDDVTLETEDTQIKTKKSLLSNHSDYFKAMFSGAFSESDRKNVKLKDVNGDTLKLLISNLGRPCCFTVEQLLPIYELSSMLQFTEIQETSRNLLRTSLIKENCLATYPLAYGNGDHDLATAARVLATWKFLEIVKMPQFLNLEFEELLNYLKEPGLYTESEWKVWEAICDWIQHDELPRAEHLFELIQTLDFKSLTKSDLCNLCFYPIVSEQEETRMLIEAIIKIKEDKLEDHKAEFDEKTLSLAYSLHSRQSREPNFMPCAIGFTRTKQAPVKKAKMSDDESDKDTTVLIPVLFRYNTVNKSLTNIVTVSKLFERDAYCQGFKTCSIGPYVYFLGGEYSYGYNKWNQTTWCFNTITNSWVLEEMMPDIRRHFLVCVLDKMIYLIGGYGKHRIIQSSVMTYNTSTKRWKRGPELPESISSGAACGYQKSVILFTVKTAYVLHENYNNWTVHTIKSEPGVCFREALVWGKFIFLLAYNSKNIYIIDFSEEKIVYLCGEFQYEINNVCLISNKLYNFTRDYEGNSTIEISNIVQKGLSACDIKVDKSNTTSIPSETVNFALGEGFCISYYSFGCFPLMA